MSTIFNWNITIDEHVQTAESDKVRPILINYLPKKGKILEGGAGIGRCCIYLQKREYDIIGVEIKKEYVSKVNKEYPNIKLIVGDVSALPFANNTFDAYISLGVIEHFYEGPETPLSEMFRVLAPNGIAIIITVPAVNFNFSSPVDKLVLWIKSQNIIRRLFGKKSLMINKHKEKYKNLLKNKRKNLVPCFKVSINNGCEFFEYRFPVNELDGYLAKSKFEIILKKPTYHKDGLYHSFGFIVGTASEAGEVKLNIFGKILNKILMLLSKNINNHMFLYVVRKVESKVFQH